ncbi:MAG: Metallo-beta-lactamase family protein [Candidatus Giovannonibacteria bacterium GW2011_GWA2_53_7]|uniref:Ribonuclease J n=1 Tax=Candidatus Giovannonibacteria bacterium GW2011_GWA2_53_7 TaxID=1618650 RepID=A0A0G2A120_9BACT|nr:MAG: Metallo-beta-lactamase family protein [Candidatus Giovannonibacteria bacterium GW2011_GWA2_53_7]
MIHSPRPAHSPRNRFHRPPLTGPKRPPESRPVPPLAPGNIRIITLGGVEEIGKNMTAIEYEGDIIVIDAGLEFAGDEAPGVDYIIPDISYLEANKEKIRAVLVSHGHLDHIGGIPFVMPRIDNPIIYTRNLTSLMIKKRHEEFPHLPKLNINIVEKADKIRAGKLTIRFFGVTHTIPDSMGIAIETPYGLIVTPGDYKLEQEDGIPSAREEENYKMFDREKTLLLLCDSTNVENPGFSTPEKLVHKGLDELIKNTHGRLIIGTFASQFERMIKIIELVEKYGRRLVVEGRSMKTNIDVALTATMLKIKKDTIIPTTDIDRYPEDKIVVLATGAQGEEFAALMRMATGNHKNFKFKRGDTVILSSSIIPGNEKTVQKLKDNIARQGAKIIHYRTSETYIHSSGHGNREEIAWLHRKIKPKFFVPIHGHHYMLRVHAELAMELGLSEKNIVIPDNGSVIEISDIGQKIAALKETAAHRVVMVDGLGNSNVEEVVIRDRQMLAQDGMFVIIALIDVASGKIRKSPDIISRGFIYLKESQDLLRQVRLLTKKKIEESTAQMHPINFDYVKNAVRDEIGRYLYQKTHKRPIVLPVLIEV